MGDKVFQNWRELLLLFPERHLPGVLFSASRDSPHLTLPSLPPSFKEMPLLSHFAAHGLVLGSVSHTSQVWSPSLDPGLSASKCLISTTFLYNLVEEALPVTSLGEVNSSWS